MFETYKTAKENSKKFHYECRTTVGSVSVGEVIKQLHVIAKILEDSKVQAVTFSFEATEKEM